MNAKGVIMSNPITSQQAEVFQEALKRARKQVEDAESRATRLPAALAERITWSRLLGETEIVGARCTPPGGDLTVRLIAVESGNLYIVGDLVSGRYWLMEDPRDVDAWCAGEILALYCKACLNPDGSSAPMDLDQLPAWLKEPIVAGSSLAAAVSVGREKWLTLHKWN